MTDLVKQQSQVPAYLQGYKGKGVEIQSDEISLPYLSIAQASGKAVKEGKNKYGDIYNTVTNKSFGREVDLIFIKYKRDWKEFDQSGALLRTSDDGITWKNGEALTEEEKWKHKFYNYFVIPLNEESSIPYMISFGHSSAKTGKSILNIIAQTTGAMGLPSYARSFRISTKEETKDNNSYMVFKASQNEGYVDEKTVAKAQQIEKMLMTVKINVDQGPSEQPAKENNPF